MADVNLGQLIWKVTGDNRPLKETVRESEEKVRGLGATFKKIGPMIAGAFAVGGVIAFGRAMIKSAADMEQREAAFETMLGSAEKAKKLMKEISVFAAKTPFELPELTEATKKLVAFGIPAEDVMLKLQQIGDVSSGLGVPLGEMAEIFGKARVQGTLFSEDLNQLAGRGVPIFEELAKVTGRNASEIKKMASEGKIGFGELEKVFENLTSKGGMFFGGMERQSRTFNGIMSTFFDTIDAGMREVGNEMIPGFQRLLEVLGSSEYVLPGIIEMFKMVGSVISKFAGAIATAIEGVEQVARVFAAKDRKKDIENLESSIANLSDRARKYPKDAEHLNGAVIELKKELLQAKIENEKFAQSLSGNSTMRQKLTQDLQTYNSMLDKAIKGEEGYGAKQREIAEAGIRQTSKKLADYEELNRKRNETISSMQKELSELDKLGAKESKVGDEKEKNNNATVKGARDGIAALNGMDDEYGKLEKSVEDMAKASQQAFQEIYGSIMSLMSASAELTDALYQKRIDQLDAQMQKELEAAGAAEETTVEQAEREYAEAQKTGNLLDIEEKRRALVRAQILEKYEKKKRQLEYEAALAGWGFQLGSAIAAVPLAIMNALVSGWAAAALNPALAGWYPALLAGLAGTAGGLQVAAISAAKPQPPKFAEGGIVPGNSFSGDNVLARVNSGEVILNQDQQKRLLTGNVGQEMFRVSASRSTLWQEIFEAAENGNLFIPSRAVLA